MTPAVEVRSSSLLVPTISFNDLASLTSLREAPNGSIKRAEPGSEDVPHLPSKRTSGPPIRILGEQRGVRAWDDVSESRHSVAFEIGFRKLYPAITPAHCILSDSD